MIRNLVGFLGAQRLWVKHGDFRGVLGLMTLLRIEKPKLNVLEIIE